MAHSKGPETKAFFKILKKDLQFEDSAKISSAKIQQLFENPSTAPFLKDFIQTVTKENILSPQQVELFNRLSEQGKVKTGLDLERSVKKLRMHNAACEAQKTDLDVEIQKAQKKKKRLEYQLAQMEKLKQQQKQRLDEVKDQVFESNNLLRDSKNEANVVCEQISTTLSDLSTTSQNLCDIIDNSSNGCHLLSQVQLEDLVQAEEAYNSQLTSFVKKQFSEISSSIIDELINSEGIHEVRSLADGDLFSEETGDARKEIAADVKRAELGYPLREKMLISAQAQESATHAALSFLREKRSKLQHNSTAETAEELRKTLEETGKNVTDVKTRIAQLSKEKIPGLISQGTPLQTTHLLTGNYHRKLVRQEYLIEKQHKVISLLQLQRNRLDLLWMLLAVEEAGHEKTGSQIPLLMKELQTLLNESITETEWFANNQDTVLSTPRSVFDDKDKVAMDMCKVLGGACAGERQEDPGTSGLFYRFDGLPLMAGTLRKELNTIQRNILSDANPDEARLNEFFKAMQDCESLLTANDSEDRDDNKRVCLTPVPVEKMTSHLEKEFNHLSALVSCSSKEIDKKKNFLEYNERAAASRTVWVDFNLQPNKLLKYCKEQL